MLNPMMAGNLAHLHQEEILREVEKNRLANRLPKQSKFSVATLFARVFAAINKVMVPLEVSDTSRKIRSLEC
jgi:hypothetical protein